MFSTFLVGTVLASLLVLSVLLAAPRTDQGFAVVSHPWMGLTLAVLVGALAFLGGMAVTP